MIVLILYLYFGGKIFGTVQEGSARETCRQSAVMHSTLRNIPDNPAEINCHTQFLDITEKGIVKNGDQSIDSEVTDDSVKRAIANEMYDCWYEFLQGNQEVWSETWAITYGSAMRQCVVCTEITVDSTAAKGLNSNTLTGLETWLKNNKIQAEYATSGGSSTTTYFDYLGQTSPVAIPYNDLLVKVGSSNANQINIPGDYAVVFEAATPQKMNTEDAYVAAVLVVEKAKFKELQCEVLY